MPSTTSARVTALVRASHPEPTVAVTAIATALAVSVGLGAGSVVVGLAFLSGQLSVGWSNDWIDAARDRGAARTDKPVARGELPVTAVRTAALTAALTCVPLSLAMGLAPGLLHLPFADRVADVVVAGEVLEHVTEPLGLVAEACRVLRPGGTLVLDTIAATWWGRFSAVTVGERIPAGPPKRLHDPALFVDRCALVAAAARCGVHLTLSGLRPSALDYLAWLAGRKPSVRMLATRSTAGLFQAHGVKETP